MHTNNVDVEAGCKGAVISVCNKDKVYHRSSPKVYWAISDALANAPDHLIDADIVDVICRDDFEADNLFVCSHIGLVLFITWLHVDSNYAHGQVRTHNHLASDTGVYARVQQEPLFVRDVEETPVRNPRLCGRRLEIPSIEVCVKVNDRDGPIDLVQRTENGKDDSVVTAKASAAVSNGRKGAEKGRRT